MGGFLAGAPEYVSVAGICDGGAQWDWAAPGRSRGQEAASFPSVSGRNTVIFHGNAASLCLPATLAPYVWMVALPVCC